MSSPSGRWAVCGAILTSLILVASCGKPTATPTPAGVEEPVGATLFEDVTKASGVEATYRNGEETNNYSIIESLGGGVALFDFDRDGLLDIFSVGGGYFDGKTVSGHPCKLYRNVGNFKFEDVTKAVGLEGPLQYSHGASAFDTDNDGWNDLLVSGYNRLVLLHNEPDGKGGRKFVDVTAKAGVATDTLWSTSTAWGDLNGDGFPDIYVCHYGNWGFSGTGPDGKPYRHPTDCNYDGKTRDVCQPAKFTQLPHMLFQNNGNGTFTDISTTVNLNAEKKRGPLRNDGRGIGAVMVDVNGDGRPDIYVANDTDDNFLYLNRGAKFGPGAEILIEEIGLIAGVARDDRGTANGSMGLGVSDFDHSGRASIIVTNYESELPALYQNRTADPDRVRFSYSTQSSGLGTLNGVFVSWGTGFADFDLNGWDDLYIMNGHAVRHPVKGERRQKPALLLNDGGKLKIQSARGGSYFAAAHNARGSAVGDFDNDGRPDLVVVRHNEPLVILKNIAPLAGKHWFGVSLKGKANRDLVGTRVVIETALGQQTKFVKGGSSYASTDDARVLFGLGADETILKATVHWSHGERQEIPGLMVDKYHECIEGADAKK